MRIVHFGLLVGAMAGVGSTAEAQIVAQYVSATVSGSQTVDTAGVFGPAGTDLAGQTITIFAQYRPGDFAAMTSCGPGCSLYFNKTSAAAVQTTSNFYVPDSTLIVVGVNSQHVAFAPSTVGSVEFVNNVRGDGQYMVQIGSDFIGFAGYETYPGCQVSFEYPSTVSFADTLSPTNNPSAQGGSIAFYKPAAQAGGQKSYESLTFTVNTSKR